jgi:adenylate cyclase class 2
MQIEHEAKVLEVDPEAVAAAILALGGVDHGGTLQRRYVYDTCPPVEGKWVRLRDAGAGATLAVKHIRHDGIDGTDEVEVEVGDFEAAADVLAAVGLTPNGYQENWRHSFTLGKVRLEIDSWPMIPPYLEIEADSPEDVTAAAKLLGYRPEELTSENTTKIYAHYGIELKSHPVVKFQTSSLAANRTAPPPRSRWRP